MSEATQENVPSLRFPEFSGKWISQTLLELSKNGFSNGVFNDPKKVGSGYKLINVKDMYQGNEIIIETLTLLQLSQKEFENNKVRWGDVFFTRSSLVKEGIAHSCVFLSDDEFTTYDGHLIRMSPDRDQVIPQYLGHALKTDSSRKQLVARGKTTTMTTIGQEDISSVVMVIGEPEEQKKIASFLSAVDEKIEQIMRKKELLEQYKKGVMQKLFSQEIRFKDDNGNSFPDWEEKTFGDVLQVGSGRDYKHLKAGDIPVYGTGGYMTSVDKFLYDGESVCIGRKGTIDKPMYLNEKFWTVDTLFYTHSFSFSVPKFIYAIFQTINWKKHNEASGVPSLSKTTIEKIKIKIPTVPEQQKIADFLSSLDNKIDLIATELSQARTFKKGLLQQMFV